MNVREAFEAAAPTLREFKEALQCGRLVICGQCHYFDFAKDPQAIGQCRIHGESWPFVPFQCLQFMRRHKPEKRNGPTPRPDRAKHQ
jgi:hypothetical protein